MVEFNTKIYKNKKGAHSLPVPAWVFKSGLLDFDKDALYHITISKIEKKSEKNEI